MLFMVVEHFKDDKNKDIYPLLQKKSRIMPDGLKYLDSWISADFSRCFQLIECDDTDLFQEWVSQWQDLFELEIIPVVTSKNTIKIVTTSPSH
ncbi:conserved hypothetical protein [Hyella patelloides LEGE 07179]|uniref:DUF3303 domain-containing protein n=2 Tax=Hyella TaxID=945733 RepID=A0A563VLU5_9CYAN|nr:conserved hypothetical protein [Hyella patelloides LEGE 07179]